MHPSTVCLALAVLAAPVSLAQLPLKQVPEAGAPTAGAPTAGQGTSVSTSEQFVVHGKDATARGAFCVFAEEVKGELLSLLGQTDTWRYRVVIQLRGHTTALNVGKAVGTSIRPMEGGGFHLQIGVQLGDRFTREAMREELIGVLLAEFILRSRPDADFAARGRVLPEWLRVGVAEGIEFRRRGRPTELFSSIYKSGKMLTVAEILQSEAALAATKDPATDMTSVSREIYEASCCGLVLALVGMENGPARMRNMIADLAVFPGSQRALLAKHFPGAGQSRNSVEKWWTLEMAAMAQPTVKDILGPVDSEHGLDRCLQVNFSRQVKQAAGAARSEKGAGRRTLWSVFKPRRNGGPAEAGNNGAEQQQERLSVDLADYAQFIARDDADALLNAVELRLLRFSRRAFPLHRPMIADYQAILKALQDGKTRGLDQRLAELAAARVAMLRSAEDATDYLNWYEATQVGRRSGAFADYKAAAEELRRPLPPRPDGLSRALDELDKEFR